MSVTDQNEELRDIPAETRRASQNGWRAIGVPTERSENFGGSVKRLWAMLTPERPRLALIALFAVVSTMLNVLGPKVLGHGTDVIVKGVISHHMDFASLHTTVIHVALIYATAAVLGVLIAYTLAGVVQRLMFRLREQQQSRSSTHCRSATSTSKRAATC